MLPNNRESLEAIDSAVLVLCLDDKEPTTHEQVSRTMLYGDAANRQAKSYAVITQHLMCVLFER